MPSSQGAVPLGQPQPEATAKKEQPEIVYPPALPKSQYAAYRKFLALQQQNAQEEQALAQNYGVGLEPSTIITTRFSAFMDMIWPQDTAEGCTKRLELDTRYQERLARQWSALRSQVIQAQLQQGATLSPDEQQLLQRMAPPGLFGR